MPRARSRPGQAHMDDLISHVFLMGRIMKDRMHRQGGAGQCSLLELETLRYVKDAGRPHMREVAKAFHVTPPAATLMVDALVRQKLLLRVLDPKDRRSVRVAIAPKGKRMLEQGMARKADGIRKTFGSLTAEEREQLIAIIRKIITFNE